MKRLAIFGDSYGKSGGHFNKEKSWVNFIEETKEYTVTNFSEGGASLWYTYKLFLENNKFYDSIIFLVTSPHRLALTNSNVKIHKFQNYAQSKIKTTLTSGEIQKQYQAIVDYYEIIHSNEKEEAMHKFLIDDIKRCRPDAVIYPSFSSPYFEDIGLYEVTKFENQFLGINAEVIEQFYKKKFKDDRHCHMTEQNNELVSKLFLDRLAGKNSIINLETLCPPPHGVNFYYVEDSPIEGT